MVMLNNGRALREYLLNIYFIVELLNREFCKSYLENINEFSLFNFHIDYRKKILSGTKKKNDCGYLDWEIILERFDLPPVIRACLEIGIIPLKFNEKYFNLALDVIYEKHGFSIDPLNYRNLVHITKNKKEAKKGIDFSILDYKFYYDQIEPSYLLSTHHMNISENFSGKELSRSKYIFIDEPYNFFDLSQDILVRHEDLNEHTANHYIQRWIRSQFSVKYKMHTKEALSRSVNKYNYLFYGYYQASRQKVRSIRPSTLSTELILRELSLEKSLHTSSFSKKWSIAIFLFAKFCKAYRTRYFGTRDDLAKKKLKDEIKENPVLKDILFSGCQCITALMPLEYNYVNARSFGVYSCINGLNFIFRGGMLPYVDEGKSCLVTGPPGSGKTTYALQRLIELCFYGGLAVYFSFEEPYEVISDRLSSFRMINFQHFNIEEASEESDLDQLLNKNTAENKNKGLLLVYNVETNGQDKDLDMVAVIDRIGIVAKRNNWTYRAVAVDSINSLEFSTKNKVRDNNPNYHRRLSINNLLFTIRLNKFFGIILSEQGDQHFSMLPYLTDVYIEFGSSGSSRTIQVHKARNQNFQSGLHPLRISDGIGLQIYPSLESVLSTLRHRMKATISRKKIIPFPGEVKDDMQVKGILEKTMSSIHGSALATKNEFLYSMLPN